jgi:hypothetical protein
LTPAAQAQADAAKQRVADGNHDEPVTSRHRHHNTATTTAFSSATKESSPASAASSTSTARGDEATSVAAFNLARDNDDDHKGFGIIVSSADDNGNGNDNGGGGNATGIVGNNDGAVDSDDDSHGIVPCSDAVAGHTFRHSRTSVAVATLSSSMFDAPLPPPPTTTTTTATTTTTTTTPMPNVKESSVNVDSNDVVVGVVDGGVGRDSWRTKAPSEMTDAEVSEIGCIFVVCFAFCCYK